MQTIILILTACYAILHVLWSDMDELFPNAGQLDDLLFVMATGYCVSFFFYSIYVAKPLRERRKKRREIAHQLLFTIVLSCEEIGHALNLDGGFDGCSGTNISTKMDVIKSRDVFNMNIYSLTRSCVSGPIAIDDYIVRYCKLLVAVCDNYLHIISDEFQGLVAHIMECSECAKEVLNEYEDKNRDSYSNYYNWQSCLVLIFYRTQDLISTAKKELKWPINTSTPRR